MSVPDHIARLRALLAPDAEGRRAFFSLPGCWDGLSALLIEQAGFEAAFVTGSGVAMARFGRPDLGLTTASEAADTIAAIRDRVALPLVADGDTGFGSILTLQRTVRSFERAGASAIQIEDQTFPKRCGHMAGKSVVEIGEAVGRVRAALDARDAMLVVARTDALAVNGLLAALDRGNAFLEAGADLVFVEGPRTMAELEQVAARFAGRVPLVHNLVEGGVTPTDEGFVLERLGFTVALHPLLLLHGLAAAAPRWLSALRTDRSTARIAGELATVGKMNELLGARDLIRTEGNYGG